MTFADIDVAIKFYGTLDQKGIEEFRNEFKIAYKLHHPNLLNINHFDVFENCPYLVMPYCENGSVSHHIGQMPESEIWKFVLDVSCGLTFLHTQKPPVVHQDIKPDNILITSDGRYVISDFGISRSFRTQLSSTKNKVNSSGTLAYMGPERFSEQPMVVLASDIWAFGMTLYEAITGTVLWEGMGGCVQLNGARIPVISHTTPELARLVSACLAAETWNRPTAQQIYDYAAAYIQHKPLPQLIHGPQELPKPVTPSPAPSPAPIPSPTPLVKPRQQSLRTSDSSTSPFTKRILVAAIALIGVVLVGGGIVSLYNYFSEERDFVSCKTPQDFEQFIRDHPSSSYVNTARKRIRALTPASTPTSAPVQPVSVHEPVKEKVQIVTQPAAPATQRTPVDDRIYIQPSEKNINTTTTASSTSQHDDDAIFYSCQTIDDYQSYLNTFPQGSHRAQAQTAINSLLNRNDNLVNDNEPVVREEQSNTSFRVNRIGPPRSQRPRPNGPPPRGYRHRRP